eukprot:7372136-Prymnesium_polylepis.1
MCCGDGAQLCVCAAGVRTSRKPVYSQQWKSTSSLFLRPATAWLAREGCALLAWWSVSLKSPLSSSGR